ncbi:unnamed protein product [Soboliphyme baturini]|uniref:PABS domain-containing protein n=1 Tax=Soboliphyme baturini TaxID=241478 RepID=A0A183IDW5_9BILA|nr:unnamed protein product [Soboliphyme baturini]
MANAEIEDVFLDFTFPVDPAPGNYFARFVKPIEAILAAVTSASWTVLCQETQTTLDFGSALFTAAKCTCLASFYFDAGLATFSIQQKKSTSLFDSQTSRKLVELLEARMKFVLIRRLVSFCLLVISRSLKSCFREIRMPRISRVPQLFLTSDQRLCVYNFDKVVYEGNSQYQNIKVLHSLEFGNVLLLDDLVNLAETDLVYTHQIMWKDVISYANKDVLILGGGDGGILNQVLKEMPHYVRMVDIDSVVIEVCRKFLRGACGSCLDLPKGDNYEVGMLCSLRWTHILKIADTNPFELPASQHSQVDEEIWNCFAELSDLIKAQTKFDVVFSDLTDTPLTDADEEKQKNFLLLINKALEMGFQVLKPGGFFLTHVSLL